MYKRTTSLDSDKQDQGKGIKEGLFSKITDPKVQEMLLKQIRALA